MDEPSGDLGIETAVEDWDGEAGQDEVVWQVREPAWWWGWVALVLSLAGFGDSLYLTIDHFQGTIPVCAANGIVDCAKVTTSPESEIFGLLPVALLGLIFYTVLVGVNVPPPVALERDSRQGSVLRPPRLGHDRNRHGVLPLVRRTVQHQGDLSVVHGRPRDHILDVRPRGGDLPDHDGFLTS